MDGDILKGAIHNIALYTSVLLEPKFITRIHLALHNGKYRKIKKFSNLDKCTN